MRGAWIEIIHTDKKQSILQGSRPMRGAWIEIEYITIGDIKAVVAPHAGRVD